MTVKIELTDEPPSSVGGILERVFWKEPEVAKIARDFLHHVKEWGKSEQPYTVDQWRQYTTRNNISQSTYSNMLKRLKEAGIIEKKYNRNTRKHELKLATDFPETLQAMYLIWENYVRN